MKNGRLTTLIKQRILSGSPKNESSPQICVILSVYALITSAYTWAFFGTSAFLVRLGLSILIVLVYIIIERSSLSSLYTAFLTPALIISILIFGSLYFGGDFLIFTYNTAIAMISLTYLRPKGLAAYILFSSLTLSVILFVFGVNLLGPAFTSIYNILYFMVSVALNILTYIFCRSYVEALRALTDAKNEASLAALAKGSFLANMSHEIRTPLNAIIGLTEAELRHEHPPESIANLHKIHTSGNLLMGIINDILDMSKIESGKFELVLGVYDLADLIYDTASLNMVHIGSKPINFVVSVDESIPRRLVGDDIRIRQILGNLLSNAFKYTREGQVELRAHWRSMERPLGEETAAAWLSFEVADSGMGIAEEDLSKLFSEYAQVNQKSTRGIEGTGLGLAICMGLVELMGGQLSAESQYGQGSVFKVTIPQEIVDGVPLGPEVAAQLKKFTFVSDTKEEEIEYISLAQKRVLVVDDVEINLDVAAACLEPYELQVDCITSGAQALDLMQKGEPRYDLIFMDHMMPDMDGVQTTRAIRDLGTSYAETIPIIALTANVFAEKDNIFTNNGFHGFLSKPIDLHKLDGVIKTWLEV